MTGDPYAAQLAGDAAQIRAATGLTHNEFIEAMRLLIAQQLKECTFLLADHQLPIPDR